MYNVLGSGHTTRNQGWCASDRSCACTKRTSYTVKYKQGFGDIKGKFYLNWGISYPPPKLHRHKKLTYAKYTRNY